jgi:hypothetical protein
MSLWLLKYYSNVDNVPFIYIRLVCIIFKSILIATRGLIIWDVYYIRMTNALMSIIEVRNSLLICYLYILHTVFRIRRYILWKWITYLLFNKLLQIELRTHITIIRYNTLCKIIIIVSLNICIMYYVVIYVYYIIFKYSVFGLEDINRLL